MIYLDNSATTRFKPKSMIKAMQACLVNSANPGRGTHADAIMTSLKIENCRSSIKKLCNASEHEVVFTKNCTEALNLAIFGTIEKEGHVITTIYEHNSTLRPLYYLFDKGIIKLTVINPNSEGKIDPNDILRAITPQTYLIATNHISNVTGNTIDIESIGNIAKAKNILYLVDTAQSLGHITIDLHKTNIDMLACAGHKGLHGPQGTGFLLFNNKLKIKPILYGGTGTNSDSVYQPHVPPESLEAGTLNSVGIIGLNESINWTMINQKNIHSKIERMSKYLIYKLSKIPHIKLYTKENNINGIISLTIDNLASNEIAQILSKDYNIAVRSGIHCAPLVHNYYETLEEGMVRISLGYNNTYKDIINCINAIKIIAKKSNND